MNPKTEFKNRAAIQSSVALPCLAALALALIVPARAETRPAAIPFSDIGARATAAYQGDALGVTATVDGARLRCGFQKLKGHATAGGLWLESTGPGAAGKLRLVATTLRREGRPTRRAGDCAPYHVATTLPATGTVSVEDKVVRITRPGLTEEYSVSADGLRQDFVIAARPAGAGDLRVELALNGARAEAAPGGVRLRLEGSGRALAYSRLRVEDATGRELTARLEVLAADRLAVDVADANATYPVRIDPTFTDADWVSLNPGLPGANEQVYAMAVDGSGNLYVGGYFTFMGTVPANHIAKWDGSAWSALGAGMSGDLYYPYVSALAVSGTNLYAGGTFSAAGGVPANYIAKWDGSAWSALGSGTGSPVLALAVSGTNLYAGGTFSTAGGVPANSIARWDGSAWSALGSGVGPAPINPRIYALAVSGSNLYAGGYIATAGEVTVNFIAKWDGSAWSALGSGMSGVNYPGVAALAVSGTNLYAGGGFATAGGMAANYIAKWDGSAWSALGSGTSDRVLALAVSGTNLYVGGYFSMAGGVQANYIAKWDGSAWSALGSGMSGFVEALAVSGTTLYAASGAAVFRWDGNAWSAFGSGMGGSNPYVYALAVSGNNLYAGGTFATAGGVPANYIAQWDGSAWSAVGSEVTLGCVYALAVSGTDLYVGGAFTTTAGGVTANSIVRWDGSAWSALGSGISAGSRGPRSFYGNVSALALNGTDIYAGGEFSTAGGVPANNIAKWDGSAWSALGSGVGGCDFPFVYALTADAAGHLFVGGVFFLAGTNVSPYIAQANVGSGPTNVMPPPTPTVTNCTEAALRSAMASGETVTFACSGTITLANTVVIRTNTVLDGSGQEVTISGGSVRVFSVNPNVSLTLVNLTIANGWSTNGGGGIYNEGTLNMLDLTITNGRSTSGGGVFNAGAFNATNCQFVNNTAQGAPGCGGAVYNSGALNIMDCSFVANSVWGGYLTNWVEVAAGCGGAVYNSGALNIMDCSFVANSARGGANSSGYQSAFYGAAARGGAICNLGGMVIERSLFASNTTTGADGGPGAAGGWDYGWGFLGPPAQSGGAGGDACGGALFAGGPSSLVNCTLTGNQALGGWGGAGGQGGGSVNRQTGEVTYFPGAPGGWGGSACGGVYDATGTLRLTNCTIAFNFSADGPGGAGGPSGGGGVPAGAPGGSGGSSGALQTTNGVLANCLLDGNSPSNCTGSIVDAGHNLSSDGSCDFTNRGSLNNTDAMLGPLEDNGGPTLTMALLPGSPAIDAGETSLAPPTDQRGFPRPAGTAADIGAYEYGSVMPTIAISLSGAPYLNILGRGNAGRPCRLLWSTDLSNWVPMATNSIGSDGTILFRDNCASGGACRFYLLVMP